MNKAGYYLEISIPEMMKLLEITKSKITKDENDENVPHLEITELVLIHCEYKEFSIIKSLVIFIKVIIIA